MLPSPSEGKSLFMVFFNYSTMQMAAKVVYYGPGLCGKTTNLQWIFEHTSTDSRGEMVSLATETDRTLFFDLLPIDVGSIAGFSTRIQLYTVPGQVFYNTTRKLVLKGVDGVVFVADSQRPMLQANVESFQNLEENLAEMGLSLETIPLVLQYNKRDLPGICSIEELNQALNRNHWQYAESSAIQGEGVFETLKMISKATLLALKRRLTKGRSETDNTKARPVVAPAAAIAKPPELKPPEPVKPSVVTGDSRPGLSPLPAQAVESGRVAGPTPGAAASARDSGSSTIPEAPTRATDRSADGAGADAATGTVGSGTGARSADHSPPAEEQPAVVQPMASSLTDDQASVGSKSEPAAQGAPSEAAAPSSQSPIVVPTEASQAVAGAASAEKPMPGGEAALKDQGLSESPSQTSASATGPSSTTSTGLEGGAVDVPPRAAASLSASSVPPKSSRRSRAGGFDALAELENIRRQALAPKSALRSNALNNGQSEIRREIKLDLKREDFSRARRFLLTVQVEDAQERQILEQVHRVLVDIDDPRSLEQLLLRLNIALKSTP